LLISIIPVISLFLLFTNGIFGLFWKDTSMISTGPYLQLVHSYGLGFWIYIAYTFLLIIISISKLLSVQKRSKYFYHIGVLVILSAGLLTTIIASAEIIGLFRFLGFRPTATVLAISSLLIAGNIQKLRTKELLDISRWELIENLHDGYIVLDQHEMIIDINTPVIKLLNTDEASLRGEMLAKIWPELAQLIQAGSGKIKNQELEITTRDSDQSYQVVVTDLRDWGDNELCKIIILKNITTIKHRSEELSTIIKTSNAASSSLDLGQVLTTLAKELSIQSGFQRCEIYSWREEKKAFHCLVQYARLFRHEIDTKSFKLTDYPSTEEVLKTGRAKLINDNISGDEEEIQLLDKQGFCSLLMLPLWSGADIVGLVELNSNDTYNGSDPQLVQSCQEILQKAASWIKVPLFDNQEQSLYDLAEQLSNTCQASSCYISSWDKKQETVSTILELDKTVWLRSLGHVYPSKTLPFAGKNPNNDTPILLSLIDSSIDEINSKDMIMWGSKTKLLIPMKVKGDTIGFIEFHNVHINKILSNEKAKYLQALGDQAAIAIQNAKLHYDTQEQLIEQKALINAVSAISSELDVNTVLTQIAEQLAHVTEATSAYICMHDTNKKFSRVVAEYISPVASPEERTSDLNREYAEDNLEFIENMKKGVINLCHIDDPSLSQSERELMSAYGAKTILYVPIITKGETVGFAEIWESRKKQEFTKKQINICRTICQHAAVAIQNAQLYEKTKEEIVERKRMEAVLVHDANHDSLTGLPNRSLILDRIQRMIIRSNRVEDYKFAVLFMDLDNFKNVNDNYGHPIGDKLLIDVGNRLVNIIREGDTVGRLGGDEFLILLDEVTDIFYITGVAERIQESLRLPFDLNGNQVNSNASMGIVVCDSRYSVADEMIRDADIAMYRAKELGKARFDFFDQAMREKVVIRLEAEAELRQALTNNEFTLHFQPIYNLKTKQIIGIEALIRWQNRNKGLMNAADFIPMAEEIGMIKEIDQWVITSGLRQFQHWREAFPSRSNWLMTLNVSRLELSQPNFARTIKKAIEETGIDPSNIGLEITESVIASDFGAMILTLNDLKTLGIKILLDDFGKDQSSLSNLMDYPIDIIKVDKRFLHKMTTKRGLGLLKSIISMSGHLNMELIIEGIETQEQLDQLVALGCELGQGYHLSKPVGANILEALESQETDPSKF